MSVMLVEGICKRFGHELAVNNVSLALAEGEYVCLLGASGSGKTTLLRLIAGLETPDSGRISLLDKDVTLLEPHRRGVPMVFQQPSLWPHMSVVEQIAFGMEERGVERRSARRRAAEAVHSVGLAGLENRRPGQLSGGQQQRVALARALVLGSKLVLLDEPLANLDAHLKNEMRTLLRRLPEKFGVSVLHVTHDRDDAFLLADRAVLLDRGAVAASGSPENLYRHPSSFFTAALFGETNRLRGRVASVGTEGVVVETEFGLWLAGNFHEQLPLGSGATLVFRPESVVAVQPDLVCRTSCNLIPAKVVCRRFFGHCTVYTLRPSAGSEERRHLFTMVSLRHSGLADCEDGCLVCHVSPADVIAIRETLTPQEDTP